MTNTQIIKRDFAPKGHSRSIGCGLHPTSEDLIIERTYPRNWKWGYTPTTTCVQVVNGSAVFGGPQDFATMNPATGAWTPEKNNPIYFLYARRPAAHPMGMVPGPL